MCVKPISALGFRAGKIELNDLKRNDLSNYDNIVKYAKSNFCDFLIEKKGNLKYFTDYDVYQILARKKDVTSKYIFAYESVTTRKNTPFEEVETKIYEAIKRAAAAAKETTEEIARRCIRA